MNIVPMLIFKTKFFHFSFFFCFLFVEYIFVVGFLVFFLFLIFFFFFFFFLVRMGRQSLMLQRIIELLISLSNWRFGFFFLSSFFFFHFLFSFFSQFSFNFLSIFFLSFLFFFDWFVCWINILFECERKNMISFLFFWL